MNNQNEFEDLIRKFKLDDDSEAEQTGSHQGPQHRPAFNYEDDQRRYAQARSHTAAATVQRPAGQPGARPAVSQAAPAGHNTQRPAQPSGTTPGHAQRPAQPSGITPGHAQRPAQPGARQPAGMRIQRADAQPGGKNPDGNQPPRGRDRTFRVNINDKAAYEPQPAGAGGGPPHGGPGGDDYDDDGSSGGGAGRWFKALVVLLIALGVSVFLAMFALQSASDLFGLNKPEGEISFELPENLSLSQIASLLKESGVITQPRTVQLYAGLKNDAEDLLPGTYTLNMNMGYDEILTVFRTGTGPQELTLIFYEGMTLSDIAKKMEQYDVCGEQELYDYLDGNDFSDRYEFLKDIPDDPNRYRRYEGYFFPDTYNFYENEDPSIIVQKFFNRFEEMVYTDELRAQMASQNLTLDQAVTLASIIQKEAAKTADMKMVSSIFHKRLDNPDTFPRLESDVTIMYVEDDIKPYLDDAANPDYQPMYDAYNTYVCTGLPVGPISNPGMDAIKAAIYPEDTEYYFFLADREGKFYYAATVEEHAANIEAAGIEGVHGIAMPGEGE